MGLILDKKKFQMDLVLVLWSINEAQVLDNDEHYVLWNERKEAKFVKIKKTRFRGDIRVFQVSFSVLQNYGSLVLYKLSLHFLPLYISDTHPCLALGTSFPVL